MANETHPVFYHNKCPKGCGITEATLMNSECLDCDCGWPDTVRGCEDEEYGPPDKVSIGLISQGHVPAIEAELARWNDNEDNIDMTYSKAVWDSIGKEIGWCPLTAALAYFKYKESAARVSG